MPLAIGSAVRAYTGGGESAVGVHASYRCADRLAGCGASALAGLLDVHTLTPEMANRSDGCKRGSTVPAEKLSVLTEIRCVIMAKKRLLKI